MPKRKRKPGLRPGPGGKIASGFGAAVDRDIASGVARCEAFGRMAMRAQEKATKGSIGGKGG